jgi:hypothetical protein
LREQCGEGPGNKTQSDVSAEKWKVVSTFEKVVSERKTHKKTYWNVWNGKINDLGRSGVVSIFIVI